MSQHHPPLPPRPPTPPAGLPPREDDETVRFEFLADDSGAPVADDGSFTDEAPVTDGRGTPGRRRLLAGGSLVAALLVGGVGWAALRPAGNTPARTEAASSSTSLAVSTPVPTPTPATAPAPSTPSARTAAGTTSALPHAGAQDVLTACRTILPALTGFQAKVGADETPPQVLAQLTALQDTLRSAGASTGDAAFGGHVQQLADDFARFGSTVRSGGDPAPMQSVLEKDGTAVGLDCGLAGWRP